MSISAAQHIFDQQVPSPHRQPHAWRRKKPLTLSKRSAALALAAALTLTQAMAAPAAAEVWQPAQLQHAAQRDMLSRHTGQRYRIFISVPAAPAPAAGYPVIYALDGNAAFASLALMNRTAGQRSKVTGVQPALVVGIGYASGDDYDARARTLDYTPPVGAASAAGEGGAGRFLDFIESELKPLIEQEYRIDRRRQALFGHSYGGLFVLHTLFTRPAAFQTYVAASPSIWWHERFVLTQLPAFLDARREWPQIMLTVGALEQMPAATDSAERRDMVAQRRMVAAARELAATLGGQPGGAGKVVFHAFADEDHGSTVFPALSRGLEFFLRAK